MSNDGLDAKMQYDEDMEEDSDDMMSEEEDEEEEEEAKTPEEIAAAYKDEGNVFYKRELYHKAVDSYTLAIKALPDSPMYWNNRAAAYLMLNKYEQAAQDAAKSTQLDPNFLKGYVRAAKAYLTLGKTHESIDMYNNMLLRDPMHTGAIEGKKLADLNQKRKERGLSLLRSGDYHRANQFITPALRVMTHDSELRISQVEIQMKQGNLDLAMELSTSLIREGVGGTQLLQLRSKIYYYQGNFTAAIKHLKQLLSGDPDNKECAKDIRAIRKLENKKKEGNDYFGKGQWEMAYTAYSECLEFDPDNKLFCAKLLCNRAAVLNKQRKFHEAVLDCNMAIKYDPTYTKAYMRRAQNHILINEIENLELAIRDYEHAKKLMGSGDTREIDQSIKEATVALKQAKRKDYYKILGCARDSDAKQIKKAYRKMALKWHPDKWESSSAEDAKKAEAVFKDISEAYTALSDPEKKARYDSGVDPEDLDNPMAGGRGHGHGHGGMDPNDIFNMFFQGGGGMGGGSRGGGMPQGFGF